MGTPPAGAVRRPALGGIDTYAIPLGSGTAAVEDWIARVRVAVREISGGRRTL